MEDIINEYGIGILEIFGFASMFLIIMECIRPAGLLYEYVQIFMNSISG